MIIFHGEVITNRSNTEALNGWKELQPGLTVLIKATQEGLIDCLITLRHRNNNTQRNTDSAKLERSMGSRQLSRLYTGPHAGRVSCSCAYRRLSGGSVRQWLVERELERTSSQYTRGKKMPRCRRREDK
ncbi:hypothetical protein E2C01_080307 [Portunus trituberculatus]|uniref:Uncharacterized protein n=1 Tax=Portunus trituberculatus TaxID=210409 RepID=A0A5B7IVQ1_PORTR|nr:hypothetical protein [Portunus trituberculatus]